MINIDNINSNYRENCNWYFTIEKIPDLIFYITDVQLPDVSIGRFEHGSPYMIVKNPGTSVNFSDLVVTFIVDEDLLYYKKLFNWMMVLKDFTLLSNERKLEEISNLTQMTNNMLGDAYLAFYNNLKKDIVMQFRFSNVFPYSLSGLSLTTKNSSFEALICDCNFSYNYFEIL